MFHPTTFGKYFLTRRIAVGGMAEVFGAKLYGADGFEKDLVIKQILPQYARDPEFVQSFVAEAKIAVSLTHANIVSIYELGRVDGTYFIAMEYVDGQDVFALLDAARRHEDRLKPGLALLIVEEVCRGLDYAHRKSGPDGLPLGLVHRDLNPRNVLVSRDGDVKILDFGIAKTGHKSAAMPKTRAGVVKGTTGYMSPEQATGQTIDHRTDLYQAGLLLHETLVGSPLFWRPEDHLTRDLMRRHEVPRPSKLVRGGLAREVDELVLKTLRIQPRERYQTAAELATAVARVRALRFPNASHRSLGRWVSRLLDRDRAATRALEEEIPETADFSEVISQAIEQSISSRVETIATRAPSGMFQSPKRPTTGSQPLEPHIITGDLTPAPAIGPSAGVSTPLSGGFSDGLLTPLEPPPLGLEESLDLGPSYEPSEEFPAPPRRRRPVLLASAISLITLAVLAGLAAVPLFGAQKVPEAAQAAPSDPRSAPGPEPIRPGAPDVVPPPKEPAERPSEERPTPRRSAAADFGARRCRGRVTVDGKRLAGSTPIFGHALSPGLHRVVVVGENCPIESAGALEPRQPRVSKEIQVAPGARLKLIADFEAGRIDVEPSER